jgi:hypothetical protein
MRIKRLIARLRLCVAKWRAGIDCIMAHRCKDRHQRVNGPLPLEGELDQARRRHKMSVKLVNKKLDENKKANDSFVNTLHNIIKTHEVEDMARDALDMVERDRNEGEQRNAT